MEEARLNHGTVLSRDRGWRTEGRGGGYRFSASAFALLPQTQTLCYCLRTVLRVPKVIVLGGRAFNRLFFPTPIFASQRNPVRPRQRPFTPKILARAAP